MIRVPDSAVPAPIIVTAIIGDADFAWLDGLRRAHFPPERNWLAAHLTMFHHLPPSALDEIERRLTIETRNMQAPPARIASVLSLGGGTAFLVQSEELCAIRDRVAQAFHGLLTPQDASNWRPHITVQNKVSSDVAKALQAELRAEFRPRPLSIAGLAAHWYRGGPWENIARWRFSRSGRSPRS